MTKPIPTKYYFTKDGKEEEVKLERWIWGVIYKNGKEMQQFEITPKGKGVFHQIGEVNQGEVKLWVLRNLITKKRIDIVIPEGTKLIHKYRNFQLNIGTDKERHVKVYIFGYKVDNQHSHFNFILPDDRIVQGVTDKIQLTHFNI